MCGQLHSSFHVTLVRAETTTSPSSAVPSAPPSIAHPQRPEAGRRRPRRAHGPCAAGARPEGPPARAPGSGPPLGIPSQHCRTSRGIAALLSMRGCGCCGASASHGSQRRPVAAPSAWLPAAHGSHSSCARRWSVLCLRTPAGCGRSTAGAAETAM